MTGLNTSIRMGQVCVIILIICTSSLKAWSQGSGLSPEVTREVAVATVRIICDNGVSTGSGSVIGISEEGRALILTALQVVSSNLADAAPDAALEFYETVEVQFPNRSVPVVAEILTEFVDRYNHFALVGTRPPALSEQVIHYTRTGEVKPGQRVVTFGFPDTTRLSFLESRVRYPRDRFLILDTPFPVGIAGGPVVADDGRMLGIATTLTTGEEDTNGYAIRLSVVSTVVNNWLSGLTGLKLTWQSEGKKFPTAWVIGGALAAGGGVAGVLLLTGDDNAGGFPNPPLRPAGK